MEKLFVTGNEAIGWGAVMAECRAFFGYPITPQNEVTEWFARELPRRGGVFVQSQSETGSINMLYGAAAAGVRAMTSTSSPGWSLMQETLSHMSNAELPCVVVLVQRGGPGMGTIRHAQMDYLSVTWGGGHGGYRNIVLAPASVQECHDLVQLAFYLADKYRNPVIVLSDGIIGQMSEPLEVRKLEFGPLPPKDWAVGGKGRRADRRRRLISCGQGIGRMPIPDLPHPTYRDFQAYLGEKWRLLEQEVRFEGHRLEDARLVLVSMGYTARVCREAVRQAREEGLKVGLLRPITAFPFPHAVVREKAEGGCHFLVVEDNLGQMVQDVRAATLGKAPVHFLGVLARHLPTDGGAIYPDRVLEEIRRVYPDG